MRYCFTGTAKVNGIHFERDKLIALAKEAGHFVDKRVNPMTNFLVVGELSKKHNFTRKLGSAYDHHVKQIHVETFLKQMGFL